MLVYLLILIRDNKLGILVEAKNKMDRYLITKKSEVSIGYLYKQ